MITEKYKIRQSKTYDSQDAIYARRRLKRGGTKSVEFAQRTMSSSVIDYFAVLGHKEGTLCYEPFRNVWSEEKNIITAAQVLDEAITDVVVLSAGKYSSIQ